MGRRGAAAPVVVTIYWRDIPAQVNGQSGRDRHQFVLSSKFQRAIDRAKRKADIYTADDDIAQWRRDTVALDTVAWGDDVAAAAEAEATRLEQAYSREHLGKLAFAGGFVADLGDGAVDRAELLALEELDGTETIDD
ncbi:MAG: virulence factor [Ilumatobacter sp.]|uniref:virulence factor n=1 Tax=Ilumatobacter sp. TaxID=1967498 RepID=UPI0026270108|nr:virulence factor [Ilumatobacter sp.]MDJ0769103.1 virulence factor [Ilumatobacter sp.]